MPSYSLNNITAPDQYTPKSTLDALPFVDYIIIDVTNSAIFWSIKQVYGTGDSDVAGTWQPEIFMLPGSRQLLRKQVTGIRIRAAIAAANLPATATQAQVTVEAVCETTLNA